MSLIDRYIYAVTRHMPTAQRDDVAEELRTTIEDTLDEKGSHSKKNIEDTLTELGDPEILANRYLGSRQYLIGPGLFIHYKRTVKLALSLGLPIAFFLVLISQIVMIPESIIGLFTGTIGATIGVGIQILFWSTLVFFIMERSGVTSKDLQENGKAWSPEALPQLPPKRQIPISEVITDIVTYSFLALSPLFLQRLIDVYSHGLNAPFFNPSTPSFWVPLVVGIGVVGLVKAFIKLQVRNWTRPLAIFNLLFAVGVSVALAAALVTTEIVNPAFLSAVQPKLEDTTLAQLTQWTVWTIGISIAVTIGIYMYEAGKAMVLAYRK
jgi:hypothetical protein